MDSRCPEPVAPDTGVVDPWLQTTHVYPKGVELFRQGEPPPDIFYVRSGTVKLTQVDGNGREAIIGFAFASEWLGTAAVIAGTPAPVNAVTCSVAVLAFCSARTFRVAMQQDPKLSQQIHLAHAQELCRQARRIGQLCSRSSREHLQAVLYRFAVAHAVRRRDGTLRLQLPLYQWELAEFIGVTPEHLSRMLKEMEHDAIIKREHGWLVIRDLASLSDLVDEAPQDSTGVRRAG